MNAPFTALLPAPFRQRRLGSRRRHRRRVGGVSRAIPSPARWRGEGRGRHLRDRRVLGCDRKRLLTPGRGGCWPRRRIGGLCGGLPPCGGPVCVLPPFRGPAWGPILPPLLGVLSLRT